MKSLFKFELRKLFRLKSFYFCGVGLLLSSLVVMLVEVFVAYELQIPLNEYGASAQSVMLNGVISSSFLTFGAIFVVLYACTDFEHQTVKNIYSRGFSRIAVYFVKLALVAGVTTAYFLLLTLFNFVVGGAIFGFHGEAGNYFVALLGQWLVCLVSSCFAYALSMATKKNGISLAITLFVPSLVSLVFTLIDLMIGVQQPFLSAIVQDVILSDVSDLYATPARLGACFGLLSAYLVCWISLGFFIYYKRDE